MTRNTTGIGNEAEMVVAARLAGQGYNVLELNWHTKIAEIDIVAERDKTMYFIEVKYRGSNYAGDGFDYIMAKKLRHMQRAAELWVREHNWHGPYELLAAAVGRDMQIDIRQIA